MMEETRGSHVKNMSVYKWFKAFLTMQFYMLDSCLPQYNFSALINNLLYANGFSLFCHQVSSLYLTSNLNRWNYFNIILVTMWPILSADMNNNSNIKCGLYFGEIKHCLCYSRLHVGIPWQWIRVIFSFCAEATCIQE